MSVFLTPTDPRPRVTRLAGVLTLISSLLAGCESVAIISSAIQGGESVPAEYILPEATTLVLVDDPNNLLNNKDLPRQTGSTAVHYLRFHEAALTAEFVEPRELSRLETKLSEKWAVTPIDEIARQLEAEQVIYAEFTQVQAQLTESLYRPEATLEVKVIRAEDGKRLWPPAPKMADPDRPTPGKKIHVKLGFQSRDKQYIGDASPDEIARQLANEAGLILARLFYEWKMPEPGDSL